MVFVIVQKQSESKREGYVWPNICECRSADDFTARVLVLKKNIAMAEQENNKSLSQIGNPCSQ